MFSHGASLFQKVGRARTHPQDSATGRAFLAGGHGLWRTGGRAAKAERADANDKEYEERTTHQRYKTANDGQPPFPSDSPSACQQCKRLGFFVPEIKPFFALGPWQAPPKPAQWVPPRPA